MYRVRQVRYVQHRATILSRAIVEVHEESRLTAADIVTKVVTVDRAARRKVREAAEVGIMLRRARAEADHAEAAVVAGLRVAAAVDRPVEVPAVAVVISTDANL